MAIVYSDRYLEHSQSEGHPESPQRLIAIRDALTTHGLWENVIDPTAATDEQLEGVHSRDYLEFLDRIGESMLTPDTAFHRDTYAIARLAAGGGIIAAKIAWEQKRRTIALVRPPGHHAGSSYGMGFCYLNNIAIAAEQLLGDAERIAIVDLDVHHGNGTQDIFYNRSDVLYISTHQCHIFPGTGHISEVGEGDGKGYTVNIPMNSGAGDASFELATEKIILPILNDFGPDMVLVSIGTDSHYRDPLASLTLSSKGYVRNVSNILDFVESNCSNRVALFLEGGYDLEALSEITAHIVGLFEGKQTPLRYTAVMDADCADRKSLTEVIRQQTIYWKLE